MKSLISSSTYKRTCKESENNIWASCKDTRSLLIFFGIIENIKYAIENGNINYLKYALNENCKQHSGIWTKFTLTILFKSRDFFKYLRVI